MYNYFKELHPATTTIYYCLILFFVMVVEYSNQTCIVFLFLSIQFLALFGARTYLKQCLQSIPVVLLIALFNVIFNHRGDTPFLYVNDAPLTVESLLYGCFVGVMIVSLFLWVKVFGEAVDTQKITYLLGSRFPVTALLLSMILCYYDKFRSKINKIQEVWHSYRGIQPWGVVKQAGIVLSVLMTVMLEDSVDTALSMKARGYGKHKRTHYRQYQYSVTDVVFAVLCLLLVGVYLLMRSTFLAVFCTFIILPVLYNVGKEVRWKFYQSEI